MATTERSRAETHTITGMTGSRVFQVAWTDRYTVKNILLNAGFPDNARLICTRVDIIPIGTDKISAPELAQLTAAYTSEGFGLDKEWRETWDFSAQAVTLEAVFFFAEVAKGTDEGTLTASTDAVPQSSVSKIFPQAAITYSAVIASSLFDRSAVEEAIGKINKVKFRTFKKETLLYEGMAASQVANITIAEDKNWEVSHKFLLRPTGWNMFFNENRTPPKFTRVVTKDGKKQPYDLVDFTGLFGI